MKTELDLHGYQVVEAIDIFVVHYNQRVRANDFSPISVIHGYGSSGGGSKIKTALRKLLEVSESNLTFQLDPWNKGKTLVFPVSLILEGAGVISTEILDYCRSPRSQTKILGRLRRFGDVKVKRILLLLEKQGKLSSTLKGKYRIYVKI